MDRQGCTDGRDGKWAERDCQGIVDGVFLTLVVLQMTRDIEKRRKCAVQIAFIAVSKDACWNVIRTLNR